MSVLNLIIEFFLKGWSNNTIFSKFFAVDFTIVIACDISHVNCNDKNSS